LNCIPLNFLSIYYPFGSSFKVLPPTQQNVFPEQVSWKSVEDQCRCEGLEFFMNCLALYCNRLF